MHGEEAARHAATRADALLEPGDMEGRRVWLSILGAIDKLQRTRRRRDEATHWANPPRSGGVVFGRVGGEQSSPLVNVGA